LIETYQATVVFEAHRKRKSEKGKEVNADAEQQRMQDTGNSKQNDGSAPTTVGATYREINRRMICIHSSSSSTMLKRSI
jgi:hypothetical protein